MADSTHLDLMGGTEMKASLTCKTGIQRSWEKAPSRQSTLTSLEPADEAGVEASRCCPDVEASPLWAAPPCAW